MESERSASDKNSLSILFKESSKDTRILRKYFIPILNYLNSFNLTIDDIPDFSDLLKSYTMKNKMHPNPDSNILINKSDFNSIFKTLFKKTNDMNYISERCMNRMNYTQRNILFLYFSIKYPDVMHEIACNSFTDFEFHHKICNKVEFTAQWHKYVNDLQVINNCQIPHFKQIETSFKNDMNNQENIYDTLFLINHRENQNNYLYNNNHAVHTMVCNNIVMGNPEIFFCYPIHKILVSC